MRRTLYILLITVLAISACRPKNIISREDMSNIYYDFYLADRYFGAINQREYGDSVKIYIPIIEKHGHTFEEYLATIDYYLHQPEELTKIFKMTEKKLKQRRDYLEAIITRESYKNKKWKLLDSLDLYAGKDNFGNGYYRALRLLFFKPDTLEVTSPTIDSTILNHVNSAYFLYDSIPGLYDKIKAIDYQSDKTIQDSLIKADKVAKTIIVQEKKIDKIKVEPTPSENEDDEEERRSADRLKQFGKLR